MDSYWAKIKCDSQYQLKEILDWTACLEHLQAIMKEFDSTTAPNKETLIRYFWKGLRLSIRAQLDNQGQDLDTWNKVVEKAIDIEAKANFQLPSRTREIGSRCPRNYRPLVKKNKNNAN